MSPPPDWILVAGGAVLCLFGWALYWVGMHVVGAATGAGLAVLLITRFIPPGPLSGRSELMVALAALIGIILGVLVFRRLHFGALALIGGALGLLFGYEVALASEWQGPAASLLAAVAGAVVGGLLFMLLHRQIIILITAVFGAVLINRGLAINNILIPLFIVPVSWMVQYGIVSRLGLSQHPHEEKEEEEKE